MPNNDIKSLYLMGIGGIAMGTLATMLHEKGYHVVGSDQNLYPPMSTHLENLSIPLCRGYAAEHLATHRPDLVIIGNVIRRDNPEAAYVLTKGIPYVSMVMPSTVLPLPPRKPGGVGHPRQDHDFGLLAWVLECADFNPSALIVASSRTGSAATGWTGTVHGPGRRRI